MAHEIPPQFRPPAAVRLVFAVFGFVFAGIGLSVLVFMWGSSRDGFGSPPLFFRIFASFIAVAFVAFGGTMGYGALTGTLARPRLPRRSGDASAYAPPAAPAAGYRCPHCGAPLGDAPDVSPSGDAKCAFCGRWFNIHREA